MKHLFKSYRLTAFILAVLMAGCSVADNQKTGVQEVAIKMQAGSSQGKYASAQATTMAADSLQLDTIKLMVDELKLKNVEEDSVDFEVNNLVVDLPVDGSEFTLSTEQVPNGMYKKLDLEVKGAEGDEYHEVNDEDMMEGPADSLSHSMVIKGFYNDSSFTFESNQHFEIEKRIDPPLEVTDSTSTVSVTLTLDPGNWFVDPQTGEYLDPNDPDNYHMIEANIAQSLHSMHEEYGREYENDHGEHHEGDEGGHGDD